MLSWPLIEDGDCGALQSFFDFLVRCQAAVQNEGFMAELDSSQILVQLSAKLSSYAGEEWCRHAYDTQSKSRRRVYFGKFV